MIGAAALWIWNKIKFPLVVIGGVLVTLAVMLKRAREDGKTELRNEQQGARDALQQHYDEIDSRPSDFNAAAERMRERAKGHNKRS